MPSFSILIVAFKRTPVASILRLVPIGLFPAGGTRPTLQPQYRIAYKGIYNFDKTSYTIDPIAIARAVIRRTYMAVVRSCSLQQGLKVVIV